MPEPKDLGKSRAHRRRPLVLASFLAALGLVASLAFLPVGPQAPAQQGETLAPVRVTNFPKVQEIEGSVSIRGLVPHTRFVEPEREIVVSPVARTQIPSLVEGGVLKTDGFRRISLSLSGVVKGNVDRPGKLGAVLVPDVPAAREAFLEDGLYLFPLEVTADLTRNSTFVASDPVELTVAFPRYHVYFYNESDRSVGTHLFAYLSY